MKRALAIALVVANLLAALGAASSLEALAQGVPSLLDPLAQVQAYTTADPINPDRLGLATPDGRFAIRPVQGCDWLAPLQQVFAYPNWAVPPWLGLSGTDATQPGCVVRVEGRMDPGPCLTNADGVCDVARESD